jgi:hypothetical protein
MLGSRDLKDTIEITESTVECPVRGCGEKVPRQRRVFRRQEGFKCPRHHIYISPSTFEYQDELDNILWKEQRDLELFRGVKSVKRESRIARDNSEDAVTWNVFRFLQKTKLLPGLLTNLTRSSSQECEAIYWGYSEREDDVWSPLLQARREFETRPRSGSEPDIIVQCDNALFFIEAKLASGNNTLLRSKDYNVKEKFVTGGNRWYPYVFRSDFETVAITQKKYELLRFWLLGTWIAHCLNLDFYLVNLVLSEREKRIEHIFKPHIKENKHRKFLRTTWEDVYHFIQDIQLSSEEKDMVTAYFEEKTLGYDSQGRLQRAFSLPK